MKTTLINENDFYAPDSKYEDYRVLIDKFNAASTWSLHLLHSRDSSKSYKVHGIQIKKKMFTLPLICPDLPSDHPLATKYTSSDKALSKDSEFLDTYNTLVDINLLRSREAYDACITKLSDDVLQRVYYENPRRDSKGVVVPFNDDIRTEINTLSDDSDNRVCQLHSIDIPSYDQIFDINQLKADTLRMLWHARLGHPSDHYLFNAHKNIDGIPRFAHSDGVLQSCPTCITA